MKYTSNTVLRFVNLYCNEGFLEVFDPALFGLLLHLELKFQNGSQALDTLDLIPQSKWGHVKK